MFSPQLGPRTEKRDTFTRLLGHPLKGTEKGCVLSKPTDDEQARRQELRDEEIKHAYQMEAARQRAISDAERRRELVRWLTSPLPDASLQLPSTAAKTAPLAQAHAAPRVVTHITKQRKNVLDAVINEARAKALDGSDVLSIWAALAKMAGASGRPAPLLGYNEGEGVKYQTDNPKEPVKYLSRQAFIKRMKRAA